MIRLFLLLLFLVQYCCCQLKQCYTAEGKLRPDLPCDPSANVSACCGQDWTCSTNFYCTSVGGIKEVGSCTDITWHDPGCPFPLSTGVIFNYAQNTTACDDGTFCPYPDNTTCCFNHQGVIQTAYHYDAPLPTAAAGLSQYYATNGYYVPDIESGLLSTLSTNILPKSLVNATAPSSTLATTSPTESTTPSPTAATASQTEPTALRSSSIFSLPTHQPTSSELNSSTKAGIGAGVAVGASAVGLLLYFSIRHLRRRPRRDPAFTTTLRNVETPPGSKRYEKPELTGEGSRTEMSGVETRGAELTGGELRMEMDATQAEHGVIHELYT